MAEPHVDVRAPGAHLVQAVEEGAQNGVGRERDVNRQRRQEEAGDGAHGALEVPASEDRPGGSGDGTGIHRNERLFTLWVKGSGPPSRLPAGRFRFAGHPTESGRSYLAAFIFSITWSTVSSPAGKALLITCVNTSLALPVMTPTGRSG